MAKRTFAEFAPAGMISDPAPYTVPPDAYTFAQNVRFAGSSAERFGGAAVIYDGTEPYIGTPEFVFTTLINGQPWLLYGGAWGVAVTNGTNHYDVTPAGWVAPPEPGCVTGGTLNNYICFTHIGVDPLYWDGGTIAGSVKPLPGWPANTKCRILRPFRVHLFAGDILSATGGRQQDLLMWSDAAPVNSIPPTWTPTATNQAGQTPLADGLGAISEMQPLQDYLMVYKNAAAYAVTFVGRPYIYTARRMAAVVGSIAPNAVAVLRQRHIVISPADIVAVDGAQSQSIIDQRVREALFGDFNAAAAQVACAVHYPAKSEVWVALPTKGADYCNLAGIWNYTTDRWTLRALPNVSWLAVSTLRPGFVPLIWSTQAQSWEDTEGAWSGIRYAETQVKVIGCSPDTDGVFAFDMADTELGQPIEGRVERLSMPIGGTRNVKQFIQVYPRISGPQGTTVYCRIGVQMDIADAIQWGGERPVVVGPDDGISGIPVLAHGRFLSVSMRASQAQAWTIDGFGVDFHEKGRV